MEKIAKELIAISKLLEEGKTASVKTAGIKFPITFRNGEAKLPMKELAKMFKEIYPQVLEETLEIEQKVKHGSKNAYTNIYIESEIGEVFTGSVVIGLEPYGKMVRAYAIVNIDS